MQIHIHINTVDFCCYNILWNVGLSHLYITHTWREMRSIVLCKYESYNLYFQMQGSKKAHYSLQEELCFWSYSNKMCPVCNLGWLYVINILPCTNWDVSLMWPGKVCLVYADCMRKCKLFSNLVLNKSTRWLLVWLHSAWHVFYPFSFVAGFQSKALAFD